MKHHPDKLKQHEIIDHIRDALEAHLGVREVKVVDGHTVYIHHYEPGAYDQVVTIHMDVWVEDYMKAGQA